MKRIKTTMIMGKKLSFFFLLQEFVLFFSWKGISCPFWASISLVQVFFFWCVCRSSIYRIWSNVRSTPRSLWPLTSNQLGISTPRIDKCPDTFIYQKSCLRSSKGRLPACEITYETQLENSSCFSLHVINKTMVPWIHEKF